MWSLTDFPFEICWCLALFLFGCLPLITVERWKELAACCLPTKVCQTSSDLQTAALLMGRWMRPRSNESLSTKLPGHQVQHHLACPTLQKTTTVRWTWLRRAGFFHWDQVHRHTSLLWPIYLVNLWIANYCLDRLWKSQISFFLVWPNWKQKMHLLTRNHGRKSMEWARLLRQQ